MKWIGKRTSFIDEKQKVTIVIHPENSTLITGLMGGWVAMWFVIGATVTWSYFTLSLTEQEEIILFVFMFFWLYYAIRVTRSFFWILWGKELIMIDEASFYYKKSIRGYGKSIPYYLDNISNLRVYIPKNRSLQASWEQSPWVKGGERLEFDYMGKVIKFGRKLNESDAELLFKFITKKLTQRIRRLTH